MKTHFVYGSPAHPVEHTHAPFLQSAFFPHLPSHGTVKHINHNIIFQKLDQLKLELKDIIVNDIIV